MPNNRKKIKLTRILLPVAIFSSLIMWGSQVLAAAPHEEAMKVPGAKVTLPISAGKQPFNNAFIAEARKYWSNFHMQMGGDHALYYTDHLSEFLPMAITPPVGEVSRIERSPAKNVDKTTFVLGDGSTSISLDEYVTNGKHRVRAAMILHGGKVVYEAYPGLDPNRPHLWASVSKTTVGLMVSMLEADGLIDVNKPVTAYAKQLAGTEWDKVPVIDALNMSVGLDILEDLKAQMNPSSMFQRFVAADFGVANSEGVQENPVDVLRDSKPLPDEPPGMVTRYSTLTTKVLTYVIEGATGRSFTDLFGERVWSKIGARQAFMVGLGSDGVASPYGLNYTSLEDLARYALIFTPSWKVVSNSEVVSPEVLKAMQTSGSHDAFVKGDWPKSAWVRASFGKDMPTASSRQWDIVWDDGAMFKHGNLFQGIYVDPKRDVVGVYFSTSPVSGDADLLPGYLRQVAKNLASK